MLVEIPWNVDTLWKNNVILPWGIDKEWNLVYCCVMFSFREFLNLSIILLNDNAMLLCFLR